MAPGCQALRGQWGQSWAERAAWGSGFPAAQTNGLLGCPQGAALQSLLVATRSGVRRAHLPAAEQPPRGQHSVRFRVMLCVSCTPQEACKLFNAKTYANSKATLHNAPETIPNAQPRCHRTAPSKVLGGPFVKHQVNGFILSPVARPLGQRQSPQVCSPPQGS